jgi:DNA-directed RNA polymerase specialized sigma subunit
MPISIGDIHGCYTLQGFEKVYKGGFYKTRCVCKCDCGEVSVIEKAQFIRYENRYCKRCRSKVKSLSPEQQTLACDYYKAALRFIRIYQNVDRQHHNELESEALFALVQAASTYNKNREKASSFIFYLKLAIRLRLTDFWRREKRHKAVSLDIDLPEKTSIDGSSFNFNILNDEQKEVIRLMFYEDRTSKEISNIMNVTRPHVNRVKRKSLMLLRMQTNV